MLTVPEGLLLRAYVSAVVMLGVVAIAFGAVLGHGWHDLPFLLGLILAGALSERFKVGLFGDSHVSLAAVACMAAALVGGPRGVALVAPSVALAVNLGGVVPLYKTLFNIAVYTLASLAFLGCFNATALATSLHDWPQVVLPATLGVVAYFAVNAGLVAVAVSLAARSGLCAMIRKKYLWLVPHYLPLGMLAAALAVGYRVVGVAALPLFAVPIASIQVALLQYARAQTASDARLREVHERLQAVETELTNLMQAERWSGPGPYAA